jgi:hypothetical protein
MGKVSVIAFCCLWIGGALSGAAQAVERAIVIAVSQYPYLDSRNLEGPANDASLMLGTLKGLGVPRSSITLLADTLGASALPTRANILSSLKREAERALPGDWLVVYFAGHGSQVPQVRPGNSHVEPDGLDEIFLPRDTRRWIAEKGIVEGSLRDDDIGLAFDAITAKGANVWAIFDTCHAGDMAKSGLFGPDAPVYRYVTPYSLGVPVELISRAFTQKPNRARQSKSTDPKRNTTSGQRILFYAAGPDEPAAEENFPNPDTPSVRQRYGVFTYALNRHTLGWQGSFRELSDRINRFYKDRPFPTPHFEGPLDSVPSFPALAVRPDKSPRAASLSIP